MDIALDKVCELIVRLQEVEVKEGMTDPDSGSNAIDDGATDVLVASADDASEEQIREFLVGLSLDERYDIIAMLWIGRDDFESEEWPAARTMAQDRDNGRPADYILGIPKASDFLEEGLAALGRSCVG